MYSIEEFFRNSLLDSADHDDKYHDNLEIIADNDKYLNDLRIVLEEGMNFFNKNNVLVIVSMIKELISYKANVDLLYPVMLELMYQENSYDCSISPRITQILINIKREDVTVFKDIVERTNENDTVSVGISLCSLYSNYPNFEGIPEITVNQFLEKIYKCVCNNQNCNKLKHSILYNLLPILQKKDYRGYYLLLQELSI